MILMAFSKMTLIVAAVGLVGGSTAGKDTDRLCILAALGFYGKILNQEENS